METLLRTKIIWNSSKEIQNVIFKRCGHTIRGRPPTTARSLDQRLAEETQKNPVRPRINIGFPQLVLKRLPQAKDRLNHLKEHRKNAELEKLARHNNLTVDLAEVKKDWLNTNGPHHIRKIAEHYGIYDHLYGGAYFMPRVPMDVSFSKQDGTKCPVFCGNVVKPTEAAQEPEVHFDQTYFQKRGDNTKETYWSLLLTNPDGNLDVSDHEYIHWFIGNIRNGDIKSGEKIVPYLQPIPPKGTGFHRYTFVLYKQDKKIDFTSLKNEDPFNLSKRTFKTIDFYVKHQDSLTPVGLSFFQSDWEPELSEFYRKTLNIDEPIYEYDFPKAYITDQVWFPHKQPFNLYMDRYRDQKQIAFEYLEKRLQDNHPFDGPKKPLLYPNAHPMKNIPSWLKTEKIKDRLRWGRINDYL